MDIRAEPFMYNFTLYFFVGEKYGWGLGCLFLKIDWII